MRTMDFARALAKARAALLMCVALATAALTGCGSTLPRPISMTEPRGVYVWPLKTCPSDASGKAAVLPAVLAAVATPLLNDLVSGLIGVPVAALQSAAAADKNGFNVTTMNPAMFFPSVEKDAKTGAFNFAPPGCYVVAYTRFEPIAAGQLADASRWCEDKEGFAKAVDASTCTTAGGKARLAKVHAIGKAPAGYGLASPDAYFEIQMQPEVYRNASVAISRPKVLAMYYPKSLIEPASDKPRAVTLVLTHAPVIGGDKDPTKATSIGIYVPHMVPRPDSTKFADALANQQSTWTTFPATITIAGTDTQPAVGESYYPVTISANLKEIGDPNAFLQAFSAAFASGAGDLTKAVVNNISPAAQATAAQQGETNQAAYFAALSTAASDLSKLITACTVKPTTDATNAAALAAFNAVKGDRAKANAAAMAAGVDPQPFPNLEAGLNKCF